MEWQKPLNFKMKIKQKFKPALLILFSVILFSAAYESDQKKPKKVIPMENQYTNLAFIGTYTKKEAHVDGKAAGIYAVVQNPETGILKFSGTQAEITNPSFVLVSVDEKHLYAVSELGPLDAESGFIYSFDIGPGGSLEKTGKLSTGGFAPCHIASDQTGNFIFVSNYSGGVVMVYRKRKDGSLEQWKKLELGTSQSSHLHSVTVSPNNKNIYIADLGEDKIWIYDFDPSENILEPSRQEFIALEKGSGPRHLVYSGDNKYIFSVNELSSTVNSYGVMPSAGLEFIASVSSLPKGFNGKNSAAEIHLHPSGNFLYVSNRGHNSIAAFKINKKTGELRQLGFTDTKGKTPRNFSLGPKGRFMYVANQDSDSISIFEVDPKTGELISLGHQLEIPTPVCIEFF